jgi:hypothetical protein
VASQGQVGLQGRLEFRVFGAVLVNPILDLVPVVANEPLNRPGSSVS